MNKPSVTQPQESTPQEIRETTPELFIEMAEYFEIEAASYVKLAEYFRLRAAALLAGGEA